MLFLKSLQFYCPDVSDNCQHIRARYVFSGIRLAFRTMKFVEFRQRLLNIVEVLVVSSLESDSRVSDGMLDGSSKIFNCSVIL